MKRVAIFGNAGGGKSTLARELAAITGLPLHVLDKMQYRPGGDEVPREEYLQAHAAVIGRDEWIMDGFGCSKTVWERLDAADTLIHVDLPLPVHALWIAKRFFEGLFVNPAGWPERSPIMSSTLSSYRVLWPCHNHLTPQYRAYVSEAAQRKRVFHLRSSEELSQFLETVKTNAGAASRQSSWNPLQSR